MRLPRVLRWRRLSSVQRNLLIHIILTAGALLLGHFTEFAWLSALAASLITLWTVSRLLARPTLRTVIVRSLEPLLIVWAGLINLQLMGHYITLDSQAVAMALIILLLWQARFFLLQFDPSRYEPQSGHTVILIWMITNAIGLLLLEAPAYLLLLLAVGWLLQYVVAHFWLERIGFHNSFVPAAWALLITQLLWITSFVIIIYQLPVAGLLVTRLSLMVIVMAYAWGSLLQLHSRKSLTKKLVVEYGMICSFALGILIFLPAL